MLELSFIIHRLKYIFIFAIVIRTCSYLFVLLAIFLYNWWVNFHKMMEFEVTYDTLR